MAEKIKTKSARVKKSTEFNWDMFQLSPVEWENKILTTTGLMVLIAIGPMILLILESYVISLRIHESVDWDYVLRDLGDPIFAAVTLILLVGAFVYTRLWYPNISQGFRSIIENEIIDVKKRELVNEYNKLLTGYKNHLDSNDRYKVALGLVFFMVVVVGVVVFGRSGFWSFLDLFDTTTVTIMLVHRLTRWVLSIFVWGYFAGIALRAIVVTHSAVRKLIREFELKIQPYHSDKAGGLGQFGEMIGFIALFFFLTSIPLGVLGVPRTFAAFRSIPCGENIMAAAKSEIRMGKSELASCVVSLNLALGYSPVTKDEIEDDIKTALEEGKTPIQIFQNFDEALKEDMESDKKDSFVVMIFNLNSIYIFLTVGMLFVVLYLIPLAVRPLFELHREMLQEKLDHEAAFNKKAVSLYSNLSSQIETGKWAEVEKTRGDLKKITDILQDTSKYPVWPINLSRFVQIFFSPTLIMTFLTILLQQFNVTVSESASSILSEIIGSL